MICRVYQLGRVEYERAWRLQDELAARIAAGEHPPALLLLEHPPTYTFGRRGQAENLLWDETELKRQGVAVHWVDRGGDVTYHGPGQLVGYPLLPLGAAGTSSGKKNGNPRLPQGDYLGYLRKLEEALIVALFKLGVGAGQIEGQTGVWVQPDVLSRCPHCPPQLRQDPAKIVSIGVKVDAKGISRHGFALNVDPDMSYWEGILACGLANQNQVSLAQLLAPVPAMGEVIEVVAKTFGKTFGYDIEFAESTPELVGDGE